MRSLHTLILAVLLIGMTLHFSIAKGVAAQRHPDPRGTEQQPLVIREIPTRTPEEQTRIDAEQAKERVEDKKDIAAERAEERTDKAKELYVGKVTLIVTSIIGMATVAILIVQALAFWRQTRALQESVNEMRTATGVARSAADSAKQAVDAAIESNRVGREALIEDQRPWVAIRGDPIIKSIERESDGWRVTLLLMIENTGRTPAHNVHTFAQIIPAVPRQNLELESAHAKLRNDALFFAAIWYGELLFPGEAPRGIEGKVLLTDAHLAPFHAEGLNDYPLMISACVYYTAAGFKEPRITAFVLGVTRATGGNVAFVPNTPIGTQIYSTDLRTISVKTGWWAD
jgi:hypothetical protein